MKKGIIYLMILLFAIVGCSKDEIMNYEGPDAMSIYVGQYEPDSTVYTFAYSLPEVEKDTIYIKIRTQGQSKEVDRKVEMMAAEGSDAVEGKDYILPEFTFPAGANEALYPVVLLRSEILKEETKTLLVAVKENSDFEVGAVGQEKGNTYSIASYKIKYNDFLSKPGYWSNIEGYVGSFSVIKFQFMFTVYGAGKDFGNLTTGELLNMRLRLRAALVEYEATNGPLLDENGQQVTF